MNTLEQITLKQLRAVRAIRDHGTISAAAEVLRLTGPAVHNQLKTLESVVGAAMVERGAGTGTVLTPQGEVLLRAYDEVQSSLSRALGEIDALGKGLAGAVTLGVVSTGKYFAPGIVAKLKHDLPGIAVTLVIGNRDAILADLAKGAFHLCIMGRPPRSPVVRAWPLADHPHVLIAAAGHPLAGQGRISPQALAGETFVLRERGSGTRILASRFLDEIGEGLEFETVEMSSNETIKQAVMSGLGIALISAHTVVHELESGRLVALDLPRLPILRKWYVVAPPGVAETPATAQVREALLARPGHFIPSVG